MIKIEEIEAPPTVTANQSVTLLYSLSDFTDDFFRFCVFESFLLLFHRPVQRMQEETSAPSETTPTAAPSETTPTAAPPSTVTDLPPPPTSSFQLEATLRKIGKQPEVIYRYLRVGCDLEFFV